MFNNRDHKTEKIAEMIKKKQPNDIKKLLVVGCGTGIEAAILSIVMKVNVVGVDLCEIFDLEASKVAELIHCDASSLPFDDGTFDFIYCYHVLEHMNDPAASLKEMRRVLRNGGGWLIGTPNKSRIIGYIGSKDTTLANKIRWNVDDWIARLKGKFRNEDGAHAGFTSDELGGILSKVFSQQESCTSEYYRYLYAKHERILSILESSGLSNVVYPGVYFFGVK